jgi:general secretion pathway protein H
MVNRVVKEKTKISTAGTSNSRGFTLIELTVVVFLISLMLLIAVPRVRDTILSDDLKKTVTHLMNTAYELRNESVRNHVDYILHFDLNTGTVWSYSVDMTPEAISEVKKQAWHMPEDVRIADIYYFGKEKISEGEVTIRFSKKGYLQPAVLHLSRGERYFTLIFHPFFTTIEVKDTYIDYRYAG